MFAQLLVLAWATSSLAASTSVGSSTICTTVYDQTTHEYVPTVTRHVPNARDNTKTITGTTTTTSTVTPAPVTTTVTTTSTSTSIISTRTTDTVTATTTNTVTVTVGSTTTSTSTITTVTTSTSVGSTTTIATAAGFTAVAAQADYVAKRELGPFPHVRRAKNRRIMLPAANALTAQNQFPSAVTCGIYTSTYVLSISTKSVTETLATLSNTATATVTTTVSSTTTLAPVTTTTTTQVVTSATSTSTISVTTTTTSTRTVYVPQATFYAQCDSTNLVNHVHSGIPVAIMSYSSAFTLQSQAIPDQTGYSCCAYCASIDDCAGFGQHPSGTCYYIVTQGQCDGSMTYNDAYHYYGSTASPSYYTVGNGACGRLGAIAGAVSSTG